MTLTLRNRPFHKCAVSKIYNELEINIEPISMRTGKTESRVEHYPMHPFIHYDDNIYPV